MNEKLKDLRFAFVGQIQITPTILLNNPSFRFEGLWYKFNEDTLNVFIAFKEGDGLLETCVEYSFVPKTEGVTKEDFLGLIAGDSVLSQFSLIQ